MKEVEEEEEEQHQLAGVRVEEWCGGVRKVRERKLEGEREAVTGCGR